jgi:hypothetical protein
LIRFKQDHSILNRKKKFSSSDGGNSMQIFPSITDNESGLTVKGVKVFRSADFHLHVARLI